MRASAHTLRILTALLSLDGASSYSDRQTGASPPAPLPYLLLQATCCSLSVRLAFSTLCYPHGKILSREDLCRGSRQDPRVLTPSRGSKQLNKFCRRQDGRGKGQHASNQTRGGPLSLALASSEGLALAVRTSGRREDLLRWTSGNEGRMWP